MYLVKVFFVEFKATIWWLNEICVLLSVFMATTTLLKSGNEIDHKITYIQILYELF
jgi:hypothetical protein